MRTGTTAVRIRAVALMAIASLLLLAAPAAAHVGVETDNARPGARGTVTVHVPNESDTADTVKVELRLPDGFSFLGAKRNKPWRISAEGNVVTITGGRIPPSASSDFQFDVRNSRDKGQHAFPTLQTYSDGERVRWVGADGSDAPAPLLTVEGRPVKAPAANPTEPATSAPSPDASEPAASAAPASSPRDDPEDSSPSGGVGWVWVVLALLVAGAGGAAVARSRRR